MLIRIHSIYQWKALLTINDEQCRVIKCRCMTIRCSLIVEIIAKNESEKNHREIAFLKDDPHIRKGIG